MESYYCIYCNEEVTARQEALLCDKWQHRRCNTGISRQQYRYAVKTGLEVVWRCLYCSEITDPIGESSRIEEEMDAFDIPPSFGVLVFSLCKIKRSLLVNLIFSRAYRHEFQKRNLRRHLAKNQLLVVNETGEVVVLGFNVPDQGVSSNIKPVFGLFFQL